MLNLLKEISTIFAIPVTNPNISCSIFKDNNSCIAIAKAPRMTSRTKHIALKYYHFRSKVISGEISIFPIHTKDQITDILTKPLPTVQFETLRRKLCGW